jgi:hypothetical protein
MPPLFIVVQRGGGCGNPIKVKHIEEFGGNVAIIADNTREDPNDVVMRDGKELLGD